MKTRILSLLLVFVLVFSLCGCGGAEPTEWIPVRGAEQTRDISRENPDAAAASAAPASAEAAASAAETVTAEPGPSLEPVPSSEPVSSSEPRTSSESPSLLPSSEASSEVSDPAPTLYHEASQASAPAADAEPETETASPLPDRAGPALTEAPEPETEAETETEAQVNYVANTNTKKFHTPSCSSVTDMKESNKLYFTGTREELIALGYEPCKRCKP